MIYWIKSPEEIIFVERRSRFPLLGLLEREWLVLFESIGGVDEIGDIVEGSDSSLSFGTRGTRVRSSLDLASRGKGLLKPVGLESR